MRKILLTITAGISLCVVPVKAQFNTVAAVSNRYKVEILQTVTDNTELTPESGTSVRETSTDVLTSDDTDKKMWMDRYMSVSYPLRHIRDNFALRLPQRPFYGKEEISWRT